MVIFSKIEGGYCIGCDTETKEIQRRPIGRVDITISTNSKNIGIYNVSCVTIMDAENNFLFEDRNEVYNTPYFEHNTLQETKNDIRHEYAKKYNVSINIIRVDMISETENEEV